MDVRYRVHYHHQYSPQFAWYYHSQHHLLRISQLVMSRWSPCSPLMYAPCFQRRGPWRSAVNRPAMPCSVSLVTNLDPMRPIPPMTTIFILITSPFTFLKDSNPITVRY
jgi:hypothetical protein